MRQKNWVARLGLGVCVLSGWIAAQPDRWPLRSLRVEGVLHYPMEVVLETLGLKLNALASKPDFDAARDRLLATGVFETVAYRYGPALGGGYDVVFEVTEVQPLCDVKFESLPVTVEQFQDWVRSRDPYLAGRVAPTDKLLRRYTAFLEEFLAARGHPDKLKYEVTASPSGHLRVLFYPARGLPVIASVDFRGSRAIDVGNLREAVFTAATGMRYTEESMRELLESTIRPLYEERGYLRVRFPRLEARPSPNDVRGVEVVVDVEEGQPYTFRRFRIEGVEETFEALVSGAGVKTGELANMRLVRDAARRIEARLQTRGYMKAVAEVSSELDDSERAVDIIFRVHPGPQFVFRRLFIQGLDLYGEQEIRRIWGLKPGQPFDVTYPNYFLEQVQKLELFDNLQKAHSEIHLDEKAHAVDVTLYFNPAGPLPGTAERQ